MSSSKETSFIGAVLIGVACFALGVSLGAHVLGPATGKNWVDFVAMVGGWVSGLGTLIAVIAALRIASRQANHEHVQDAVRCTHHALATINDLQGRLHSLHVMLVDGGRPIIALSKNAAAIERRYEALYERNVYRHAPGSLVDSITNMSGSFFGISVLVEAIVEDATERGIKTLEPMNQEKVASLEKPFSDLKAELDALFTAFSEVRKTLERR